MIWSLDPEGVGNSYLKVVDLRIYLSSHCDRDRMLVELKYIFAQLLPITSKDGSSIHARLLDTTFIDKICLLVDF